MPHHTSPLCGAVLPLATKHHYAPAGISLLSHHTTMLYRVFLSSVRLLSHHTTVTMLYRVFLSFATSHHDVTRYSLASCHMTTQRFVRTSCFLPHLIINQHFANILRINVVYSCSCSITPLRFTGQPCLLNNHTTTLCRGVLPLATTLSFARQCCLLPHHTTTPC